MMSGMSDTQPPLGPDSSGESAPVAEPVLNPAPPAASATPPVAPPTPPVTPPPPPGGAQPGYQPPVAVAQAPRKNGLGLAALIVGGVALILAFIPLVNYVSGVIALVGLILGIIALVRKGAPKWFSLTGMIVSAVALILSIVLAIAYTTLFVANIDDIISDDPSIVVPSDGASDQPTDGGSDSGSFDNPAPAGSTVVLSNFDEEEWEVTVGEANTDANQLVFDEYEYNDAPPEGSSYVLVPVTVKYIGTESGSPWFGMTIEFVTAEGNTIEEASALIPNALYDVADLYPGASETGNMVFIMTPAEFEGGKWAISSFFDDPVFVAAH